MTEVMLAAGEASGDRLGASLAHSLKSLLPDVHISGIGGARMRDAGMEIFASGDPLAVMGYWDAALRLPKILALRRRLIEEALRRRPRLFVGIDAPDFNLGVARRLRAAGIKTAQYVSPSVWMWRASRIEKIRRAADAVWCLFPFEPAAYDSSGVRAVFVGHPLARAAIPSKQEARSMLDIDQDAEAVALMPGSRAAELELHLPLFARTMARLAGGKRVFIAAAADVHAAAMMRERLPGAMVHEGDAMPVLAAADAALVKSGTSSLQAALAGTPHVIVYKMSAVAYHIGNLRAFRLPFYGLPNILRGRFVVPELMQNNANPDNAEACMLRALEDKAHRDSQISAFSGLRDMLASGTDAAQAAAQMIQE